LYVVEVWEGVLLWFAVLSSLFIQSPSLLVVVWWCGGVVVVMWWCGGVVVWWCSEMT
jgi:hypothetical protein